MVVDKCDSVPRSARDKAAFKNRPQVVGMTLLEGTMEVVVQRDIEHGDLSASE